MSDQSRSGADANPAQLRHDIDSGKTGDKAAAVDPAAAPLGTDAEAAGDPPSPGVVAATRAAESKPGHRGAGANAASAVITPQGMGIEGRHVLPALVGAALGVGFTLLLALAP